MIIFYFFVRVFIFLLFFFILADTLCSDRETQTCDHLDMEAVAELSNRLLNALCGNSMKKHPRQISGKEKNIFTYYNQLKSLVVITK